MRGTPSLAALCTPGRRVLLTAAAVLVGVVPAASAPVATLGGATLASADAGGLGHSIAAGQNHTCALKPNGDAQCWGDNSLGAAPSSITGPFTALAVGYGHTCALKVN